MLQNRHSTFDDVTAAWFHHSHHCLADSMMTVEMTCLSVDGEVKMPPPKMAQLAMPMKEFGRSCFYFIPCWIFGVVG